jgi:hypothetical protein
MGWGKELGGGVTGWVKGPGGVGWGGSDADINRRDEQ